MKSLKSPYIVYPLDMIDDEEKNYFFLVMEYEPNGNLYDFIENNPKISDS